jgi:hypothetical protein
MARAVGYAHKGADREPVLSNGAADYWANIYSEPTQEHAGILRAVTSRGPDASVGHDLRTI